ncbi:MAG: hypothetical protein PVF55_02310 [Desulfobacterales bacterium]|jgi:hypothetical protein
MAPIDSQTYPHHNITVHRVAGPLAADDLRRTAKRFYAQDVTLNVLWIDAGADLSAISSDEFTWIVDELKTYTHSREGGKTAFVLSEAVNYGLGRMVEMLAQAMDMPFEFRSFKTLAEAQAWLEIDIDTLNAKAPKQ